MTPVDDAPVAVDDAYTVDEGATLDVAAALGVLLNDSDAESDPLTAVQVSAPSHGTLTLNADGSFSYTHDGSKTTSDSFTYKANDGLVDSNIATVSITVTAVDDAPVAVDDAYTVDEGATLDVAAALGVLSNDTDAEMSPLTAVQVSAPSHGTLTLNADGSLSYTHDGSETTSDSFTYKANDGLLDSNIATVSISVTAVDDAPVAVDDAYTVDEGATLDVAAALGVLSNDTDAEMSPLTAVQVSAPSHGTLTYNADGSLSYTHDGSETTSDSFTYKANDGLLDSNIATVSISVTAVDDAPVAVDDAYTVDEGATLDVAAALGVLSNDTDAEMSPLTAVQVSAPSHGTLTLNADGSLSYTHDGSETTSDSFTYKANDGASDSNVAAVSISVTPVNDAPVATGDTYTVDEGATLDVAAALGVLLNDSDAESDPLTAVQVSAPSHGTLTLNADGSFNYTHDGSKTTSDSFTYKANDGAADSNIATVSISVTPTNHAPTAVDDAYSVARGDTLRVGPANPVAGVLANDIDQESDPLTAVKVTDPAHGTLILNFDGSFNYIHDGSKTTSDSFTYKANDGAADSNIATVLISVKTPAVPGLSINDVSVWEGDLGGKQGLADYFIGDFLGGKQSLTEDSSRDLSQDRDHGGKVHYAVFTVTLSSSLPRDVTVSYGTAPGTASVDQDYARVSEKLKIPAGETSGTISVEIKSDKLLEPDETFYVELFDVSGAKISDGIGEGTILDDEACLGPNLIVNPGADEKTTDLGLPGWTAVQGTGWQQRFSGPKSFGKRAYFSAGPGTMAELRQDIDISAYAERIKDGAQRFAFEGHVRTFDEAMGKTARLVVEYRNQANDLVLEHYDSGPVSSAWEWERVADERAAPRDAFWIRVRLIAVRDGIDDQAGIFFDSLSLESLGTPVLTVGDRVVKEKDFETKRTHFRVKLSCSVDGEVTFDYATGDGTATAAEDYEAIPPTTVTLPSKTGEVKIPVGIFGDTIPEEDEFFFLRLANATNAVILTPEAVCVILDNDCPWGAPKYWEEQFGKWPVEELLIGTIVYDV